MRTLVFTVIGLILSTLAATAGSEVSTNLLSIHFSSGLSGTTSTGLDLTDIPQSATYGLMGAAFLVLTVLRRRKHIYQLRKQRF